MRYSLTRPALFIIIITLFAVFYFPRANSTAMSSALPRLTGEAAVNHLKEQGPYTSLIQAAVPTRATRHDARHLAERRMSHFAFR